MSKVKGQARVFGKRQDHGGDDGRENTTRGGE